MSVAAHRMAVCLVHICQLPSEGQQKTECLCNTLLHNTFEEKFNFKGQREIKSPLSMKKIKQMNEENRKKKTLCVLLTNIWVFTEDLQLTFLNKHNYVVFYISYFRRFLCVVLTYFATKIWYLKLLTLQLYFIAVTDSAVSAKYPKRF